MKKALEELRKKAIEVTETKDGDLRLVFPDGEEVVFPKGSQFLS